jgi:hypothetical protein
MRRATPLWEATQATYCDVPPSFFILVCCLVVREFVQLLAAFEEDPCDWHVVLTVGRDLADQIKSSDCCI